MSGDSQPSPVAIIRQALGQAKLHLADAMGHLRRPILRIPLWMGLPDTGMGRAGSMIAFSVIGVMLTSLALHGPAARGPRPLPCALEAKALGRLAAKGAAAGLQGRDLLVSLKGSEEDQALNSCLNGARDARPSS